MTEPSRATPTSSIVLYEVADRIATVTLNRPEARNALSGALRARLREVMAQADADPAVDVVILTGADPAFCAGLDLKELGAGATLAVGPAASADASADTADANLPFARLSKPLIGAVNGVAITGGFEIVLLCDFVVASERARFGDTHARVGILPGWGLSVELPQAIGYRRALEMSLTGNFIDAQEALELRLVNHVVAHDELLPLARRLASDIVSVNQSPVRELLASYRRIHATTVGEGHVIEREVGTRWKESSYSAEAVEASRQAIRERGRSQI